METQAIQSSNGLVLGTAQLGMPYGVANRAPPLSHQAAIELLEAATQLGYRCFDTAAAYGESEQRIGSFRQKHPLTEIELISKLPAVDAAVAKDGVAIAALVEASVQRLGGPFAGLLLHDAGTLSHWSAGLGAALLRARDRGRIKRLGVSIYTATEMERALAIPELELIQIPYNPFEQTLLRCGLVTEALATGRTLFIRSVFLQGLLLMEQGQAARRVPGSEEPLRRWWSIVSGSGRSAAAVAVKFVAATLPAGRIIVGCENRQQLQTNADLLREKTLDGASIEALKDLPEIDESVRSPRFWPKPNVMSR